MQHRRRVGFQPTTTPQGVDWWNGEKLILPCRANGGLKTQPTMKWWVEDPPYGS